MVRLEERELGGLAKEQSESREGCEDRLLAHPERKSADFQVHCTQKTPVHILVENDLKPSPDSRGHT